MSYTGLLESTSVKWSTLSLTYSFSTSIPYYYSGSSDEENVTITYYPINNNSSSPFDTAALFIKGYQHNGGTGLSSYASYAEDIAPMTFTQASGLGDLEHLGYVAPTINGQQPVMQTYMPANSSTNNGVPMKTQKAGDSLIDEYKLWHTGYADLPQVAVIHEIAHSLGLIDANIGFGTSQYNSMAYTVMSSNFDPNNPGEFPRGYQQYDIAAIQALYGANFTTRSGDTTYVLTNDTGLLTIWDGGGNDTIDISAVTSAATIDLAPGAFSSIGGVNNVAMALTSHLATADRSKPLIENVIGTAYDDTIKGNSAANLLRGGAGHNTMSGSSGDDHIISTGSVDYVYGNSGNDLIELSGAYAGVGFNTTSGADVVEATIGGSHSYSLTLQNLTPADVSIIAGGEDLYAVGAAYFASDIAFEFVTFKINATGEEITFVDPDESVGTNAMPTYAQAGIAYAQAHSPVATVKFSDGTVWSAADLWNHIGDRVGNTDVTWDLMYRGSGTRTGNTREIEHDSSTYESYVNSQYFVAAPIASAEIGAHDSGLDLAFRSGTPHADVFASPTLVGGFSGMAPF